MTTSAHNPSRRALLLAGGGIAALLGAGLFSRLGMSAKASGTRLGTPGEVEIEEFGADGKSLGISKVAKVVKTEEEWKAQLSDLAFNVTRQEGTEYPGSSTPTPSTSRVRGGPASTSRSRKRTSSSRRTGV
jgi:hypothetical protein